MDEGAHRPPDDEYWLEPWARVLFSGDVFEAIPFGDQPTTLVTADEPEPAKHYLGEVSFGYGLLISPTCDMHFEESVACLFRPSLVSDGFLADPPRRVQQMHPEARRQLKIKLAAYWSRVSVARDQFPLHERDEESVRSQSIPASVYDFDPETAA